MISFDNIGRENIKRHNAKGPQIAGHLYRILISWGSGWRKTNASLILINHQFDIDKIYLYAQDPYEAKYQLLIHKRKRVRSKHCNDIQAFIE